MKYLFHVLLLLFTSSLAFSQGFDVKTKAEQTFSFSNQIDRNQILFFSETPLEDIEGTANDISGSVSFLTENFTNTLKGSFTIKVESMKTGISTRDRHLRSANWLDADQFPEIHFQIKNVTDVKNIEPNKLSGKVNGTFNIHGTDKDVSAEFTATYLEESERTKAIAEGDLLGVKAEFEIKLSDFGVENQVVGSKVAENILVKINLVGVGK